MSDKTLHAAIESALHQLWSGPTLGEFGIARDDCALVHIDYFTYIEGARYVLAEALAQETGRTAADVIAEFCPPSRPCDCRSCAGPEKAAEAHAKHREMYDKVAAWKDEEVQSAAA
jgi:hypothetical protein